MPDSSSATISVVCACGKKLKAPASAVGKKAKCPKCNNIMTLTAPPPREDDFDALYDLAEEGNQAAAQQQDAPRCPGCMAQMMPGDVLCTNCGFDTRKGKAVGAIAPPPLPARSKASGTRFDPAAAAAAFVGS